MEFKVLAVGDVVSLPVSSNITRTSQSPCKKNFLTVSSLTSLTLVMFFFVFS